MQVTVTNLLLLHYQLDLSDDASVVRNGVPIPDVPLSCFRKWIPVTLRRSTRPKALEYLLWCCKMPALEIWVTRFKNDHILNT